MKKKISGFICLFCKRPINVDNSILTHNRNHCPFCLWSKHVDAENAGDRKSKCKGAMAPIGLTFKKEPPNKYGPPRPGELMIIHVCTSCGQLRINRLSADDDTGAVLQVFGQSLDLDEITRQKLEADGIHPSTEADRPEIKIQLFGKTQVD